ncbi:MAG: hypothetical protein AB7K24_26340 [Gemmataceae bacterium]
MTRFLFASCTVLLTMAACARADELAKRLVRPVTIEAIDSNTPIKEALVLLADHCQIKIRVDNAAFRRELKIKEPDNMPVKLPRITELRLEVVLELIAYQAEGTVCVTKDEVLIVPCPNRAVDADFTDNHKERKPLWTRLPAARAATNDNLDRRLNIEGFEPNTPLKEALGFFAERYGLNVLIDVEAFQLEQQEQEPENRPVHLEKIRGTLRGAIAALLKQARATYTVHDNLVLVIPIQPLDKEALKKLTDGLARPETRGASARLLAESDHIVRAAVPHLLQALRAETERPALKPDRPRLEKLLADIDSEDFAVREGAALALRKEPEAALRQELQKVLPLGTRRRLEQIVAEQASARASILFALNEIAPEDDAALDAVLVSLINEEDAETRRQASKFLQGQKNHWTLRERLEAKSERVRAGAVAALGVVYENLPRTKPMPGEFSFDAHRYEIGLQIKRGLDDSSPQVRETTLRTMKRLRIKKE